MGYAHREPKIILDLEIGLPAYKFLLMHVAAHKEARQRSYGDTCSKKYVCVW